MDQSTFHAGEQAVQRRLGLLEEMAPWGRQVVRSHLPEQHRGFYSALPFVVAAARDDLSRPWATILAGRPGFVRSPDPASLVIDASFVAGDALDGAVGRGADVGLLGIELATRRRNRVNGVVDGDAGSGISIRVSQAFGNCPQHISERDWRWVGAPELPAPARRAGHLDRGMRRRIAAADTFFIATGHRGDGRAPSFGMDASHRGGPAGFVEVAGEDRLVFPDYSGNNHFNTIGNIEMDPRTGLLFVDFETGGLLQLTGRASVEWDRVDLQRHPGAQRLVSFEVDEVVDLPGALPVRWQPATADHLPLRVSDKRRESEDVVSFHLTSVDGAVLPRFEPGQYLPLHLALPGEDAPLARTYSLSGAPGAPGYRISVKRERQGRASRWLHDQISQGTTVTARPPSGTFTLEPGEGPVVLAGAGIGITPLLSMLHDLVERSDPRDVYMLRVARDGDHDPHQSEIRGLAVASPRVSSAVYFSRPAETDVPGRDFDAAGRPNAADLLAMVGAVDADFYLCGPVPFMASLREGLIDLGVEGSRIRTETFGASGSGR